MISIGRVSAGDAGSYYLDRQAGCELDYYTGEGEQRGRWLGDGAAALGLTGRLDEAGEQLLRALLSGCGADGTRLVKPLLRADPRGLLPAGPLIRALDTTAARRGGADLLGDGKPAALLDAAVIAVAEGRDATLPADIVGQAASAAGLDPVALYQSVDGKDAYTAALRHVGRRVDVRRPGLDVTVSAPKSVSFLYALADPAISSAARTAHEVALREVVAYLQRHAATAARGHQGGGRLAPRIGTEGLIVAAFEHRTSRAGDPQLHTHLVIPNLVRGADGRWSAMDTAGIYRHARTASSLYHAVLRGELTRSLGVAWTPVRNGIAEIDGIPRAAIETFSKRRQQIVSALAKRGSLGVKAAQVACLATRPAKKHEPRVMLRARWHAEAAAIGIDPAFLAALTGRAPVPDLPVPDVLAARLFGAAGVTKDKTTFTRRDLARALCETLPAGTPVRLADVDRLVTALIAHPDVLPVVGEGRERRYTTRELLATERHALTLATTPPARPVGLTRMQHLPAVLARTELGREQQAMVATLVTSGRRVDVVAGPAGSGKTAAVTMAARIWAHAGHPVKGATVSWLAAQNLQAATGITTASLAKTLRDADQHGLRSGVVLVLDEASLVNTRTLSRVLEHVAAADGKLVLVGDPAQLPEIGAGGLFAALANRPMTIRLTGNERQQQPWERAALRQLREGNILYALDAYVGHRRIHTSPSSSELLTRIARDYASAREEGEQTLVLAARRRDVARLNRAIRAHLIDIGHLGPTELTISTEERELGYRVGEQVLVTVNDQARGLVNGTRCTVTALNPRQGSLQLQTDDGRAVVLDHDWLATGHLTHGYAVTVHKAQGLTVDTTLIYGLGPLTHEHAYVALSRGRLANHIYLAHDQADGPDCRRPDGREVNTASLTAELQERLATRGAHRLASSYYPERLPYDDTDDRIHELIHHDDRYDRGYGLSR